MYVSLLCRSTVATLASCAVIAPHVALADVPPPDGVGLSPRGAYDTFSIGNDDGSVDLGSGNLVLVSDDVPLAATANGEYLGRVYNSLLEAARDVGRGWTFDTGYDVRLVPVSSTTMVFVTDTGFGESFTKDADGAWRSRDAGYSLTQVSGGYVVFDDTGYSYTFDASGQLTRQTLPGGEQLRFEYTSAGGQSRLSAIGDPAGAFTRCSYNGLGSAIEADTPASQHFYWGYDSSNRLTSFTDQVGRSTSYTYEGSSSRLSRVTYPGSATLVVEYHPDGRVASIALTEPGEAPVTSSYAYGPATAECPIGSASRSVVIDANGSSTSVCFNTAGDVTYSNAGGGGGDPTLDSAAPDSPTFAPDFGDGDDGTCYLEPDRVDDYCGEEDSLEPSTEPLLGDPGTTFDTFAVALDRRWGISDNNPFDTLNIFAEDLALDTVNYGLARLVIPFNIEAVGERDLKNARDWVAAALEAGRRPLLSLERCRHLPDEGCKTYLPGAGASGEYHDAFKAILDDPAFAQVKDFTAWNEPNHRNYQPTALSRTATVPTPTTPTTPASPENTGTSLTGWLASQGRWWQRGQVQCGRW